MVMIHDDYILFCTSQWVELKDIVERCGGNESEVVESIQRLAYMGFLESRTLKNNLFYKKQDKPQSHDQFSLMMDNFLEYQKFEIDLIKKTPTRSDFTLHRFHATQSEQQQALSGKWGRHEGPDGKVRL